jgi:hypothetical protein
MQSEWWSRLIGKFGSLKPIGVALAFSPWLIILYLGVSLFVGRLGEDDQKIIQSFIEWFGTAYSLFLALVLVNVWAKFEALERKFDAEVDAIATLYQTTIYIEEAATPETTPLDSADAKSIECIKDDIRKYVHHVIHNYREEDEFSQQRRNGDKFLTDIGHSISALAHNDVIKESFIHELFTDLNATRDVRSDRISQSKQRMPETVWWVAIIASIVWLLPFLGLVVKDPWARSFLIVGVTFVITIVLVIIKDLDEPYEGTWKIGLEEWHKFFDVLIPTPHILFLFSNKDKFVDSVSRTAIGRRFSLSKCKLSLLTHEDLLQRKWKRFLHQISITRSRVDKTPSYEILYSNSFTRSGYGDGIPIPSNSTPSVFLRRGDKFDSVMSRREIEECANFAEFEETFYRKIRQFVPWF